MKGLLLHPDCKWICLEGTIAAGKSTLLRVLEDDLGERYGPGMVLFIQEPVDDWVTSGHLALAQERPYMVQTHFFQTRVESFLSALEALSREQLSRVRYIVTERSMYSDFHVFWHLTCLNQKVDAITRTTYQSLWKTWTRLLPFEKPDLFIYLTVDASTAQERMVKRHRECEQSTVDMKYQTQLIERHDELFMGETAFGVMCVQISSLMPYHDNKDARKDITERIVNLFK